MAAFLVLKMSPANDQVARAHHSHNQSYHPFYTLYNTASQKHVERLGEEGWVLLGALGLLFAPYYFFWCVSGLPRGTGERRRRRLPSSSSYSNRKPPGAATSPTTRQAPRRRLTGGNFESTLHPKRNSALSSYPSTP